MFFAFNRHFQRVHIIDAIEGEDYCCPTCGAKLLKRRGDIKIHHFAHYPNCKCSDIWTYDNTDWHYFWLSNFPHSVQEGIISLGKEKHRCDLLLENINTVVFFQKEHITANEFKERNRFFHEAGYKVIWLFDFTDEYALRQFSITNDKDTVYWSKPKRFLKDFDPEKDNTEIFFQLSYDTDQNIRILNQHVESNGIIVKLAEKIEDDNIKSFRTHITYDTKDFCLILKGENLESNDRIRKLSDKLFRIKSNNRGCLLYGCTKSENHYCISTYFNTINNPEGYPICDKCTYFDLEGHGPHCRKRILDAKIDKNYIVTKLEYDDIGLIDKIIYKDHDGNEKEQKLEEVPSPGESLYDIWDRVKPDTAVFYNVQTKKYVKIIKDPLVQQGTYHNVYGYISTENNRFNSEGMIIYYPNKKCWILNSYNKDNKSH